MWGTRDAHPLCGETPATPELGGWSQVAVGGGTQPCQELGPQCSTAQRGSPPWSGHFHEFGNQPEAHRLLVPLSISAAHLPMALIQSLSQLALVSPSPKRKC